MRFFIAIFLFFGIAGLYAVTDGEIISLLDSMKYPAVTNITGITYVKTVYDAENEISPETSFYEAGKTAKMMVYTYYGSKVSRMLSGRDMFDSLQLGGYYQSSHSVRMDGYIRSFRMITNIIERSVTEDSYRIILYGKAEYVRIKGKNDPDFHLTPKLEKGLYYPGDVLKLSIQSDSDGYLAVFIIREDEACHKIFPEDVSGGYLLKGGKEAVLPGANIPKGFVIPRMKGGSEIMEILRFIITKSNVDYSGISKLEDFPVFFSGFGRDELEYYDIGIKIDNRE